MSSAQVQTKRRVALPRSVVQAIVAQPMHCCACSGLHHWLQTGARCAIPHAPEAGDLEDVLSHPRGELPQLRRVLTQVLGNCHPLLLAGRPDASNDLWYVLRSRINQVHERQKVCLQAICLLRVHCREAVLQDWRPQAPAKKSSSACLCVVDEHTLVRELAGQVAPAGLLGLAIARDQAKEAHMWTDVPEGNVQHTSLPPHCGCADLVAEVQNDSWAAPARRVLRRRVPVEIHHISGSPLAKVLLLRPSLTGQGEP